MSDCMEIKVNWEKFEPQRKEELKNWPFCHFTPMEYIDDSDSDGHINESSSGYSCAHCGHTKPLDWIHK